DEDEEEETARLEVKLLAPDQAVPDVDSVQVEALSFSTRDRVRFNLPMQDLDGLFGATIPVEIGDRPEVESGDEARRVRSFSERYRRRRHRRRDRDELDIPFAVSGDDVIHLFYEDPLPERADDRAVVDVAGVDFLRDLETIHDLEDLPEEAREEGVSVELTDPYTRLNELKGTQRDNVLEEIARQKVHYRRQIERYEEAIAEIDEQIKELEPEEEPEDGGSDEDGDEPPDSPDESVEVPEADAQPDAAEVAGVELADSDRLIRISNLRRRKEGLEEAVEGLRGRAGDLERYDTEEMEKKFEEMFDEASPDAEDGASDETDEADEAAEKEGEEEVEWYEREDWWKECALIPGVSLNVSVRDPDIPDEREKIALEAVVLGSGAPETREFTARRSENDVFEAVIQTHRPGADGDGLSVAGGESLILTYEDEYQDEFSADRSSFVTLASTAEVFATDAEYRAERDSYKLGEYIHVLVQDPDMSKTAVRDYVWVDVESESGGSTSVALRETQRHSGEFRGAVSTRYGESQSNGELRAGFNDEVSITYADELGRKDVDGVSIMERHAVFDPPGDAEVEGFARQLRRGALERDVLFNTARAHFELGKRSLEGGAVQRGRRQLMESRSRLLKLISMYPDEDVAAHGTYYLGNIRFLLGEYEEAVDNFRQVVERWPESEFKGKALFKLGMAHMEADKMDEAIESFVSLAYHHQDSPLVADAMLALSKRFGDEENYQRAIGIGRAFLDKFPDHEKADDTYMRLASWLINEEKHAEAVELLEEAEKEMPESPHMPAFLYWRADCMVKMGDTEKAVVALQRVKYDYPDTRWARYAAARLAEVEE
ncbi:MAG: tetratricopeptide repeat protein, partial [Planctomycetota bacterium]